MAANYRVMQSKSAEVLAACADPKEEQLHKLEQEKALTDLALSEVQDWDQRETEAMLMRELQELHEQLSQEQERALQHCKQRILKLCRGNLHADGCPRSCTPCCTPGLCAGERSTRASTVTATTAISDITAATPERHFAGAQLFGGAVNAPPPEMKTRPSMTSGDGTQTVNSDWAPPVPFMKVESAKLMQGWSTDNVKNNLKKMKGCMGKMQRCHSWFGHLEEPERKGPLADIVRNHKFELLTLVVIGLNGALIIYQTNKSASKAMTSPSERSSEEEDSFTWDVKLDYFFTLFFLIELMLRISVHRLYFFCNNEMWWNIFDAVTILPAPIDMVMHLFAGNSQVDVGMLRALRIFRMTRSLRVLRALHFVQSLRQLVDCILTSFSGLFWCMVLLTFLTGTFSVFLVQATTFYFQDGGRLSDEFEAEDVEEVSEWMRASFGSVQICMLSLLKATSGGEDWGAYFDLLRITGWVAPLVMVGFILFFIIAAWNIVTSLFVEKALALAQPDIEHRMMKQKKQNMADAKELLSLLETADVDHSGTISIAEFSAWMNQPEFKQFLECKGVDVKDAEMFFHMLEAAAHSDEIHLHVAVNGLMRMRGIATNLDLHALNFTINSVYNVFDHHLKVLTKQLKHIQSEVVALRNCAYEGAHLAV